MTKKKIPSDIAKNSAEKLNAHAGETQQNNVPFDWYAKAYERFSIIRNKKQADRLDEVSATAIKSYFS